MYVRLCVLGGVAGLGWEARGRGRLGRGALALAFGGGGRGGKVV